MGNGIYNSCFGDSNLIVSNNVFTFDKQHRNWDQLNEDLFYKEKIIRLQNSYRMSLARKILLRMISAKIQEFETELKHFGFYVLPEEISKRRGDRLSQIEQNFPKFKKKITIPFTVERGPIVLTNDHQRIYEGSWSVNFYRNGYGCLYEVDGTKIEGIWKGNVIPSIGRIYFADGRIYEGDVKEQGSVFFANGKGTLYYEDGRHTSGQWISNTLNGSFTEYWPNKFIFNGEIENGKISNHVTITYLDKTTYVGNVNERIQKHGKGLMAYSNGERHEGEWINDQYAGAGIHFFPENSKSLETVQLKVSSPNRRGKLKWGDGTYIDAIWIKGQLNGKGHIITSKNVNQATWRFGKLIQLEGLKSVINPIIFTFLNLEDLSELSKLKSKTVFTYLAKNNYSKLLNIRFNELISYHKDEGQSSINGKLKELFNKITNIDEVFKNFAENVSTFIPMVGYRTNGGSMNRKSHYSNIFNPSANLPYFSNYLSPGNDKDVFVTSVFNSSLFKKIKNSNSILSSQGGMKKTLIFFDKILQDRNLNPSFSTMIDSSKSYIPSFNYDSYSANYSTSNLQDKSIELNITKDVSFNTSTISLHHIYIHIPFKVEKYLIMTNPVKTLAVYLHDQDIENLTPNPEINYEAIRKHQNSQTIENPDYLAMLNMHYKVMNTVSTENSFYVEIDSNQVQKDTQGKRLCALILLKAGESHYVSLRPNYHVGKYITVQLIDQTTADSKFASAGIDVGTINFYGQVYSFKS